MYGIGGAFSIKVIGNVYLSEVLAIILLPFVSAHKSIFEYKNIKKIIFGYILVFFGLLISDYVNNSSFDDSARGSANIVFALTSTVFILSVLKARTSAFISFLLATSVANFVWGSASYALVYDTNDFSFDALADDSNIFKIRVLPFLLPFILVVLVYLSNKKKYISHIILWAFAILFFYFDARSSSFIFIFSSIISLYLEKNANISILKMAPLIALILLVLQVIYMSYTYYSLNNNKDGHNNKQISTMMNPYNPFELILGGRAETFVAMSAIMDRPITGFGSWAEDETGKYNKQVDSIKGYDYSQEHNGKLLIPAHSTILGFWIWGGIISLIGILFVFQIAVKSGWSAAKLTTRYQICVIILLVSISWDMFFSPVGTIRLLFPQAFSLFIILGVSRNEKHKMGVLN